MRWLFYGVALAYPLLVYAGLSRMSARWIGLCVAVFVVLRLATARGGSAWREQRGLLIPALGLLAVLVLLVALSNEQRWLFLLPAFVNGALLATFGASLFKPPTVVEAFARLQTNELSDAELVYCRSVTKLWCAFFLLNGSTITWLALEGTPKQWASYTGFIAYVLVGLLFASEYVYRHYRFRRYVGAPTDPLLRKLFPPREAPGGPG